MTGFRCPTGRSWALYSVQIPNPRPVARDLEEELPPVADRPGKTLVLADDLAQLGHHGERVLGPRSNRRPPRRVTSRTPSACPTRTKRIARSNRGARPVSNALATRSGSAYNPRFVARGVVVPDAPGRGLRVVLRAPGGLSSLPDN